MKGRLSVITLNILLVAIAICLSIEVPLSAGAGTQADERGVGVRVRLDNGNFLGLYAESHALVIGVSDYKYWRKLDGVKQDVKEVSAVLKRHGFNVTLVENPTSEQLNQALENFRQSAGLTAENRLLIYFAGHGHTLKTKDKRERGFIVPADAQLPDKGEEAFVSKAISMDKIENLAVDIQAKHAMFLFDSCFSGFIFEMRSAERTPEAVTPLNTAPASIWARVSEPVRLFMTAGTADQKVPDDSIFRDQFIKALDGEADLNRDGYITGFELGEFLKDKVTNYSKGTQTPRYGTIRNSKLDRGDFVFVLGQQDQPFRPFALEGKYIPSGWMGDVVKPDGKGQISVKKEIVQLDGKDVSATRIDYQQGSSSGWAGIYWQYPENNWGDKPGLKLTGAKKISFYAKGERGGEIVKFKSGGINDAAKPHHDTFERTLEDGEIVLSNNWKKYEIDLSGSDLSNVIGGFAWASAGGFNKGRMVIYLANIRVE